MPEETVLPVNPEELLTLGKMYAYICAVPENLFEDAVQEFAIGAWQAVMSANNEDNLRAFQVKAGQWAMLNFLKAEMRYRRSQQRIMEMKFSTTTTPVTPLDETIQKEQAEQIDIFLNSLQDTEKAVVNGVVMDGKTQEEVAKENNTNQSTVSRILNKIFHKILKNIA